jgi:hypothetical protein
MSGPKNLIYPAKKHFLGVAKKFAQKSLDQIYKFANSYSGNLAIWSFSDPRLDLSVFQATVPTILINQDQQILDMNPAFALVFGKNLDGSSLLKKGDHLSKWFSLLENFRRVETRTDGLYGEALLPLADRKRAVFKSPAYGRMVFAKFMQPILDRKTGKQLGWIITLNINSVNKRDLFFKDLEKMFRFTSYSKKFAASFDALIAESQTYKAASEKIRFHLVKARRVLEIKAHSGSVTASLPHSVEKSYVDHRETFLRCIKEKFMGRDDRVRLIKKSIWSLGAIPEARFDGIVIPFGLTKEEVESDLFSSLYTGIADNKLLSVIVPLARGEAQAERYLKNLHKDLQQSNSFDTLKFQYQGFADYLRSYISPHLASVETINKTAEKSGFAKVSEKNLGDSYILLQFAKLF